MNARAACRRAAGGGALLLGIAAAGALSFVATRPARAVCTITPLTNDVPDFPVTSPALYSFTQSSAYWTAIAVKPPEGEDWDMVAYSGTAPDPTCVTGTLTGSNAGGTTLDFIVGDFNRNAPGTYYAKVNRFSGSTGYPIVQWDDGPDLLVANGASVTQDMNPTDLVRVYDVFLGAGTTYTFDFFPQSSEGVHMFLFRNALGGTYWAGRSSAELDLSSCGSYTAPTTGYYAVVVTNEGGVWARYTLGVTGSACSCPSVLTTSTTVASPSGRYAWEAIDGAWQGVAVRPSAGDWDLSLYGQPSGGSGSPCYSGLLASSGLGGSYVDLAVGDFHHTPYGWSFPYPTQFSGGASATLEQIARQGTLVINGQVSNSFAASDLAHVYEVHLEGSKSYELSFAPGMAGISLLVFANIGGGTYYAGRSAAVLSTITSLTYIAPVAGDYALVVVNDDGVVAGYTLAVGDCSAITPMVAGLFHDTPTGANYAYYSCAQVAPYWTAVGSFSFTDWDLTAEGDNTYTPWPTCTSLPYAGSSRSLPRQDVIVGDFNNVSPGTFYVRAHQYTLGTVATALLQWDSGYDRLIPNDNNVTTATTDVFNHIKCWDIYLNAGQQYEFAFTHSPSVDLRMLLFQNTGGGAYWAGRDLALFDLPGSTTIVAPASGYYGFVVVNDNGGPDTYTIQVKTCDGPTVLTPAPFALAAAAPKTFVQFTQAAPYWTPIAVRADVSPEDWDLWTYSSATGGAAGTCFDGVLASSTASLSKTDFVIGDFNYNPYGTYYTTALRFSGTSGSHVQYFQGSQTLIAGGAHAVRTKPSSFLVESWDAPLTAGAPYILVFTHDPGLDAKALIFPSSGGVHWEGRGGAYLETPSSASFTGPTTGTAGIVVVSDGGSGSFDVALVSGTLDVETVRPARDVLSSVSPNPGRGGMRFDYALREGATVEFEVLDMAGRVVSRLQPRARGTGTWSEDWSAIDVRGGALPAGLYFVRMRAGERTIGWRKVTLLR